MQRRQFIGLSMAAMTVVIGGKTSVLQAKEEAVGKTGNIPPTRELNANTTAAPEPAGALAAGARPRGGFAYVTTVPDRIVVFKTIGAVELRLHVFLPPAPGHMPAPAIVYLFGGGWRAGEPKQFFWQARYLADRGIAGFCAEYRIKGKHGTSPVEALADAKSALRYVRTHAAEMGIDPHRVAACGNSAGAQLAAAAGLCSTGDDPADPAPEISSRADALLLFDTPVDLPSLPAATLALFPSPESAREFSPLQNLRAGAPPMLLWHGVADAGLPVATVENFVARARALGIDATLEVWPGGVHGFYHYGRDRSPDVRAAFLATTLSVDRWLTARHWLVGEPHAPALLALITP
jgi:acetyl esterase